MIQALRKAAYSHGYLIITAAWLYTISFVFTNYWSYSSTPAKVKNTLEKYIAGEEKKIDKITSDTATILSLVSNKANAVKTGLFDSKSGLFIYTLDIGKPTELYWNTNAMFVDEKDLFKPDGNYPVNNQNGFFEFIKRTVNLKSQQYIIAALVPIRWNYNAIDNKYLKNEFAGFPDIEKEYELSNSGNAVPIVNSKGQALFSIEKKINVSSDQPDDFSIALRVFAIIFLLMFINALANDLANAKGFLYGLIFGIAVVSVLRILTYEFPFPFDFRALDLFDSGHYASSAVNPSLGDLLINVILVYWMISFIKFNTHTFSVTKKMTSEKTIRTFAVAGLVATALLTFEVAGGISGLVTDSTFSFDVTNFYGVTVYTIIGFIIICFLVLSFYHLSHLLLVPAIKARFTLYQKIVIAAVAGLLLLSFNIGESSVSLKITTLLWLLTYIIILEYRMKDVYLRILRSSFFLMWALFFMSSVTGLVISENRNKEIEQREKDAYKLAQQTDPAGENMLNIAITNFSSDFLTSNFYRFYSEYSNKFIKDSLINEKFSGYLNRYETHIYTFDSSYNSLYNDDSTSYLLLQSIINTKGKETNNIPDLYYYENGNTGFSYLYKKTVKSPDSLTLGYLIVVAKSKLLKSDALYPELFRQPDDVTSDLNTDYAYAIYTDRHLINNYNSYSFADSLLPAQLPKTEFDIRNKNDYKELWYNAGNNKTIVIVKNDSWVIGYITLFAYLFCMFICVVVLFHFGRYFLRAKFRWKNIKSFFVFNIRTQIHATIIFISIFSFVVIGAATISFFISRFNDSNREKLSKSIQIMATEIQDQIKNSLFFDNMFSLTDLAANGDLERKIIQISEVHDADVNFYDVGGSLLVSTQPSVFNKQILSNMMQPEAFYELHYNHSIQYMQQEKIGNLFYLSIYMPVKDENGNVIAYLNLPYLNSQNELHQEISNFLVTLINLNALIFVLAGAIALLVTNRITASFSLIGNKMKEINLGKMNEEILWGRNDEIGALVNEYNKMVKKLEASAQSLARSEREEAWREMARQVAHEIKNPLTPMKLSIQYLQKALNENAGNIKALSQQVAGTLIEQIDQLSKIAGDFSQFANIGNVVAEKFDLAEIISSLVNLYRAYPNINIEWEKGNKSFEIFSDKIQITRLFTNLIKNAIEASLHSEEIKIIIRLFEEDENAVVSIKDNGTGIAPEMQQKIFMPNFTTKSSGTGLGLAICKGIAEKANGKIWFQTAENNGTTFYVSLPVVKN